MGDEQVILVPHGTTPTGWGVAMDSGGMVIYGITQCCAAPCSTHELSTENRALRGSDYVQRCTENDVEVRFSG